MPEQIRVSDHPRARRQIAQAKGWGALAAFGLVVLVSWQAGVPAFDVGVRGLAAGVLGYVVAWAVAVQVWRHLAVAEVREVHRRYAAQTAQAASPEERADTMIVREGAQ
jgi:hypothetical protein